MKSNSIKLLLVSHILARLSKGEQQKKVCLHSNLLYFFWRHKTWSLSLFRVLYLRLASLPIKRNIEIQMILGSKHFTKKKIISEIQGPGHFCRHV